MRRWCERCLWADQCVTDEPCVYFTPLEEELIDNVIEWNRYRFREEWFRFVEELEED